MKTAFINQVPQNHGFIAAIAALSAFIKQKSDHDVALFNYRGYNRHQLKYQLKTFAPDVIAFSTVSLAWVNTQHAAKFCKSVYPQALTICGGYHPTLAPDEVIADPYIDIICRGEGEEALLDLLNALKKGDDYSQIKNLWVKKDGKIHKNGIRPLIENLDSLPFPDRDLFDYNAYTERSLGFHADKLQRERVVTINTGKGCYFSCTYCSNAAMRRMYKDKGKYIRYRSVDNVIREMKILKERYNPDYIESKEELFATDEQWLEEFAEKYPKEIGLPIKISYRVELATEKKLELLVKSGVVTIGYGVECGNEEYRKKYLNRKMSNQQIIDAFERTKDVGIEVVSFNMIGLPYETYENIQETIALNRLIKPDFIHWFTFQPYPGTELYELCKKDDFFLHNENATYFSNTPNIKLTTISQEEFEKCVNDFIALEEDLQGFSWRDPKIKRKLNENYLDTIRSAVPRDKYELTDLYNNVNPTPVSVTQWQQKYKQSSENLHIIVAENQRREIMGYLVTSLIELRHNQREILARKYFNPVISPEIGPKKFLQKLQQEVITPCCPKDASHESLAFLFYEKIDLSSHNFMSVLDIKKMSKNLMHRPVSILKKIKHKAEKWIYKVESITQFDEKTDELWDRCSKNYPLTIIKNSRYLNWRYAKHPEVNYLSVGVFHKQTEKLCGLAILRLNWRTEERTSLVEWLVPAGEIKVAQILLRNIENSAILGGTKFLETWFKPKSNEYEFFTQNGYNPKDTNFALYVNREDEGINDWHYTMGDSDYF